MRTDSAGPSGQTRFSMDPQQSVISASVSSGVHLQDNTGTIPNKYVPEGRQLQTSQPQSSVHRGRSLSIAQVVPTPRSRAGNINDTCNVNDDTMDSINGNSDRDSTIFEEGEGYDDSAAGGFQSRNKTNYQSFRLDSNSFAPGTLHRGSVVHVIPNQRRYTSFRLRRSLDQTHAHENDKPFTFLPSDQELTIPPKQLSRATRAIKHVAAETLKLTELQPDPLNEQEEKKTTYCDFVLACCCRKRSKSIEGEEEGIRPSTEITPEMERASRQGWGMMKNIMFPALPQILQDLWVYLELVISIAAFILSIVGFAQSEQQSIADSLQVALSSLSIILALIDAYFYFIQSGSIARGIKACRKGWEKRRQAGLCDHESLQVQEDKEAKDVEKKDKDNREDGEECEKEDGIRKKRCRLPSMSDKWKERFDTWFELVRTILSELLLYPLIMFDMFSFITDAMYNVTNDPGNAQDFSFFVVGSFYLILGVYVMRVFMVAGSMISLIRLPTIILYQDGTKKGSNASTGNTTNISRDPMLILFCVHILGQIAVHLLVILVVSAKINNEHIALNQFNNETDTELSLPNDASPFLILAIILGWVVPICGVLMFFVVNYYWMKEFTIGFWLNMISLLQQESFAETVFGGSGMSMTKEKVMDFVEKSEYEKVKKQLKRFKVTSFWTKFFFPVRVPLAAFCGLLYDIGLLSLIACLMLTLVPDEGTVKFVVFAGDSIMTTIFMISVTVIIVANIHLLVLFNVVLLIVILILVVAIAIAVFLSPMLLCVYFPTIALTGYAMLCIEPSKISQKCIKKEGEEIIRNPTFEMDEPNIWKESSLP